LTLKAHFRFIILVILWLCCPWILRSSSDLHKIWRLHHRPVELPLHSYSIHQHKLRCTERKKTNSTWFPVCSSPLRDQIIPACNQCREERIGSSSMHYNKDWKDRKLISNAIGQCKMQRYRHRLKSSSTGSIFLWSLP